MRTEDFLNHHGIESNPFAEEDAQTDRVFKTRCVDVHHPAWDKVYGDPADPATSLVFGEKGAGKTAMRLQIVDSIERHNKENPNNRLWVIQYDDFNPLLDRFADRLSARKQRDPSRVLGEWRLWDHMDGVLSLGVTDLVDRLLGNKAPRGPEANQLKHDRVRRDLDPMQKRDLLLLAACYDDSSDQPLPERWRRLRGLLGSVGISAWGSFSVGILTTLALVLLIVLLPGWTWLPTPWPWIALLIGWLPWYLKLWNRHWLAVSVRRNLRVLRHGTTALRSMLMSMPNQDLADQPLPNKKRTDDRYELLGKFQGILRSLGVTGVVVLVDRVDEPHLTGGRVEYMRDFVWSMLDNKFLKQPGIGFKLLLPSELMEHLNRESRDFHQRARLDKQNVISSLDWTGEALGDLADARLAACAMEGKSPRLRELIDPAISDQRLRDALQSLRTPRHMFKFLFRMFTTHCNSHSGHQPAWQITPETFEAVLAVYSREQAAVDRGLPQA